MHRHADSYPRNCSANNTVLKWTLNPHVRYSPTQTPVGYVIRNVKLGPPARRPEPPQ